MEILAKTIRNFGIIAVQGIDDPEGKAMRSLVDKINEGENEKGKPYNYQFNLSAPVGPADEKEQYAFIYNRDQVYPVSDPRICGKLLADKFKWEPYLLAFHPHEGTTSILFITIHTDAENTQAEIDTLYDVVTRAEVLYAGQHNITILGNFHADEPFYNNRTTPSPLKSTDFIWLTDDECKSTLDGKAYNKILATKEISGFLLGPGYVYNITEEYNLTQEQTEAVSSHYPVYTEYLRSELEIKK